MHDSAKAYSFSFPQLLIRNLLAVFPSTFYYLPPYYRISEITYSIDSKMTLLHVLVILLSLHLTLSADGCGHSQNGSDGGRSVKCGTECTGNDGSCTCGVGTKSFNHLDNTTWCCGGSDCTKTEEDYFWWLQHNLQDRFSTPTELSLPW